MPLVLYLLNDDYDYNNDPKVFSATTLLKPTKKSILSSFVARSKDITVTMDIADKFASIRGQGIHRGIEESWDETKAQKVAKDLGMFVPTVEQEERLHAKLEVDGVEYTVSGKFDAIIDGIVCDWKTESVYSFGDEEKIRERRKQLSIYAWLCHQKGKNVNTTKAQFTSIFQDWSQAIYDKISDKSKYPSKRFYPVELDLIPFPELERWMKQVIRERTQIPVEEINQVRCTPAELWQGAMTIQYFANDTSTKPMKNFTGENARTEANAHLASKGKGVLRDKPAIAKACNYCFGRAKCEQYQELKARSLVDPDRNEVIHHNTFDDDIFD